MRKTHNCPCVKGFGRFGSAWSDERCRAPKSSALPTALYPDIQFLPLYHGREENQRFFCLWSFLWSKPLLCYFRQSGKILQTQALQGFAAFRLTLSRIQPRHSQKMRREPHCTWKEQKTAAAMGAAFASRREKLSKQRHYNRQAAEKQEMEAGNLLFCEFRLYGGLDFCYNAENVRKAGTVYANEKKKQSGAADGGV